MKILLLDTAFASAGIYDGLVEAGHDVWVMGNRPADLLANVAGQRWIDQNYSDVDSVRGYIDRLDIERVVPGCTDVSIETCLQLSCGAHLRDSVATNLALSHKAQFRAICAQLNLPAPRVVNLTSFPQAGHYICKPVDAFSGRGISVFDGEDEHALATALADARLSSRTGEALVETYVEGQLHSCSGFLENCKFTDTFFVREGASVNPYAVDTSYVVYDLHSEHVQLLTRSLERLAQHLGLKDGLLHTQFILSDDGPTIVEVTRRCPGDLYTMLIEYSTGFRYAAKYASYFGGYRYHTSAGAPRHVLRHTVTANARTKYRGLAFDQATPTIAFYPLTIMGEELLERQGTRAGLLFAEYPTSVALQAAYRSFMARQSYFLTGTIERSDSKNASL